MRRWRAAWMGCAAALVVAACGGGSNTGGAKPPHGNTLIVGETGQPYSLDPGQSLGNYDLEVMFLVYDPLLRADPKTLKPQPGLATAWNWMGANRLTLRLTLRQGVSFQDGTPFDAQAVKTSMDHYRSTHLETDLTPVSSVQVVDTHTVDIHLSAPYSPLPEVLTERAGMIVSPAALQKYGPVNIGQHPVGTGPFKLDSWVQQQELKFSPWTGYWQKGKTKLAGIDWKVISDPTALASAIQAGQVDYSSNIQPTNRQALQEKTNLATKVIPTLSMALIQLNTGLPPVNSALVREAIDSALDRKGINNVINGAGIGGPAWQYVPSNYWTYSKNLKSYPNDPAKARQLLAQAGHPNGITLSLCAAPDFAPAQLPPIEKANLARAGITVDISVEPALSCGTKMNITKSIVAFQVGWGGAPDPYLTYFQLFGSHGTYNVNKDSYPGVDDLLAKIASTYTQAEQKPLYDQLNKIVFDQSPAIPLYYTPNITSGSKRVAGVVANLEGNVQLQGAYFS